MNVRPANGEDLDTVIALTRAYRQQLAEWSPVYFNPRTGADENHAGFLGFLIQSDEHTTSVLTEAGQVIGFFVVIDQGAHRWVDDLCLSDANLWQEAVQTFSSQVSSPWITCVSALDLARNKGLEVAGAARSSTYFARQVEPGDATAPAVSSAVLPNNYKPSGPSHTFGGSAFLAETPGALVFAHDKHGYVIGSPSASPPIYDPGGPTWVIDQVVGSNRAWLVEHALRQAQRRGDAQVIAVCAESDRVLASVLLDLGFTAEVHLYGIG